MSRLIFCSILKSGYELCFEWRNFIFLQWENGNNFFSHVETDLQLIYYNFYIFNEYCILQNKHITLNIYILVNIVLYPRNIYKNFYIHLIFEQDISKLTISKVADMSIREIDRNVTIIFVRKIGSQI